MRAHKRVKESHECPVFVMDLWEVGRDLLVYLGPKRLLMAPTKGAANKDPVSSAGFVLGLCAPATSSPRSVFASFHHLVQSPSMWKFPGQGLNLGRRSDKARSLTFCATGNSKPAPVTILPLKLFS